MKKIICLSLFLSCLLCGEKSYSQFGFAEFEEIQKLKSGTLVVNDSIFSGNSKEYNLQIKDYFTNTWKFCKVEFVNNRKDKDIETLVDNSENIFYFDLISYYENPSGPALPANPNSQVDRYMANLANAQGGFSNPMFAITQGYKKEHAAVRRFKNYTALFPLIDADSGLVYFIEPALINLENYLNLRIENKIEGDGPKPILKSAGEYYAKNISPLKNKVLYIYVTSHSKMKSWRSIEKYANVYPYKCRIANMADINEAFKSKNENVAIAYMGASYCVVINASDYKIMYFKDEFPMYEIYPVIIGNVASKLEE